MKILAATLNYDHPQTGQLASLRRVASEFAEVDYLKIGDTLAANRALADVAAILDPDWIWMQLQDTAVLTAATIRTIRQQHPRCVVTHWTGDLRREVSPYLQSICRATHATFISSVGQIPMFQAAGAPLVEYVQIGLDVDEDVNGSAAFDPPFRVPDVVFCGNFYGQQFPEGTADRSGAVRALIDAGFDVGVVGSGWPAEFRPVGTCHVKQQHHVWRRAKVALSVNHFNGVERYYSDRQLIAMASGTPVVARRVPGIEQEFEHGKHCFFYEGLDELVRYVGQLMGDEGLRYRMGTAARAEVVENHTWDARIRQVLPTVKKLRAA